METKNVAASKVAKEVVWLMKFLMRLRVVSLVMQPMILFCNNNGVVTQSKKPINH